MDKQTPIKKPFAKKRLAHSILLSSALIFTGCGNSANTDTNVSNHLKRGTSYMEQGQYKAALIETKNAIQKAPKSPEAAMLMAQILNSLGQSKNALDLINEITDSDANAEFLFTKVDTLLNLRKSTSALKLIESNKSTLQQADNKRLLLLEGQTLMTLTKLEQATEAFEKVTQNDPENTDARLGLAKIYLQNNKTKKAEQILAEIFTLDPNNFEALTVQARLQYFQGNLTGAEDSLSNALAALPNTDIMTSERIVILRSLSEVLTQQGRSAEALLYSKILAEARPGMDELQQDYSQAAALLKEGQIDKAEELLTKVIEAAPYHEGAAQLLGIINYSQGDLESAEQHFTGNIDPETAPEQAKAVYAMTSLKLNKPDTVLELLGEGIESDENPKTLSLYGMAALAAGKYADGEKSLKKVLSITPNASRIRLALATHYNSNAPRRPELALQQLTTAYQQTPKDPYVQSALIQQHINLNHKNEAQQIADEIARSNPDSESSLVIAGNYNLANLDFETAKERFLLALKLNDKSTSALQGLGKTSLALKQYDDALSSFKTLISLNPQHPLGYKGLISVYEIQGEIDKGIKLVDEMVQSGQYAAPAAILAEYYGRNNDFKTANAYIEHAKAATPEDIDIQKLSATLALAEASTSTDIDQARVITMRGLTESPNDQRLLSMLTNIEIKAKNYREASKLISQIESDNQQLSTLLRANLAEAQADTQLAIKHYRTAWHAIPSDLVASKLYNQLTLTGDTRLSGEFLSEWLSMFPNSLAAAATSSNIEINSGRYNNAIKHLEQALSNSSQPPPALLNNLAWAYMKSGNQQQALKYSKQAYKQSPDMAAIIDTYGWILYKTGNTTKALELLEKASNLAPDNQEIQAHYNAALSSAAEH